MAQWKPVAGFISTCKYCGEQVGNNSLYCTNHRTQEGRKKTFEENVSIIKENKTKGFKVQETLKDWR